MSDTVKNYPKIQWNLPGMRPLQVGLVLTMIATTLSGILANPLFTLANDAVVKTEILQASIESNPTTASRAIAPSIATTTKTPPA
ncbi:MAG: NAD(P)H-quinone oxidoreductase subunit 2, partial [Cyanobacteria bacterium P01_H01_bin.130]